MAWFAERGVTVERVLSDNGSCYRFFAWRDTCAALDIKHNRTRPYRPQTNGKIERFHRTLSDGWAHATHYNSETERRDALPGWLHFYNHPEPTPQSEAPDQPTDQPVWASQLGRADDHDPGGQIAAHHQGRGRGSVLAQDELAVAEIGSAQRTPRGRQPFHAVMSARYSISFGRGRPLWLQLEVKNSTSLLRVFRGAHCSQGPPGRRCWPGALCARLPRTRHPLATASGRPRWNRMASPAPRRSARRR